MSDYRGRETPARSEPQSSPAMATGSSLAARLSPALSTSSSVFPSSTIHPSGNGPPPRATRWGPRRSPSPASASNGAGPSTFSASHAAHPPPPPLSSSSSTDAGRRRGPPSHLPASSLRGPPSSFRDRDRDRDWDRDRDRDRSRYIDRDRNWDRDRDRDRGRNRSRDRDISVEDIDAMRAQQRYGKDAFSATAEPPLTPRSSAWGAGGGSRPDWDKGSERQRGSGSTWLGSAARDGPPPGWRRGGWRRSRSPPFMGRAGPGPGPGPDSHPSGGNHTGSGFSSPGFGGRRFPAGPPDPRDSGPRSAGLDNPRVGGPCAPRARSPRSPADATPEVPVDDAVPALPHPDPISEESKTTENRQIDAPRERAAVSVQSEPLAMYEESAAGTKPEAVQLSGDAASSVEQNAESAPDAKVASADRFVPEAVGTPRPQPEDLPAASVPSPTIAEPIREESAVEPRLTSSDTEAITASEEPAAETKPEAVQLSNEAAPSSRQDIESVRNQEVAPRETTIPEATATPQTEPTELPVSSVSSSKIETALKIASAPTMSEEVPISDETGPVSQQDAESVRNRAAASPEPTLTEAVATTQLEVDDTPITSAPSPIVMESTRDETAADTKPEATQLSEQTASSSQPDVESVLDKNVGLKEATHPPATASPRPEPEDIQMASIPSPIIIELTEEEREQRLRSAIVRLSRDFESWQADANDLVHRNKRLAKRTRTEGHLPSGVPSLHVPQDQVDIWLLEEDDPVRRAEQQTYFAQLRDDVATHLMKERAALNVKAERLKKEYLSLDRSWQQHCNRLQRLEERRDPREGVLGNNTPFNSISSAQTSFMQPSMSGLQRRPAMQMSISSGLLSAGGLNGMSSIASLADDFVTTPSTARANRRGGASAFPGFGDAVRSEAEFLEILASLENADMQDPNARAARTTATVPDLILNANGEPMMSNYDDDNGFVADPVAFYFDDFDPDVWTEEEKSIFERKYAIWPKQFGRIAASIPGKSRAECVRYYYLNKKQPGSNFKAIAAARSRERKRKNRIKPKKAKGSELMADLKMHDIGDDEDLTESRGELVDSDVHDGTGVDVHGGGDGLTPASPPPRKRRKEDPSNSSDKKSKTKGRRSKGDKKGKDKRAAVASPSDASGLATSALQNLPSTSMLPLAPIGEHEESELAAAEMLNALAGIVTSPQANISQPLPSTEDARQAKKKRKVSKGDEIMLESSSAEPTTSIPLAAGAKRPRQSTSSYWSIDEKKEFLRSLAANGKEWTRVAVTLQTKSAAQARNYFMRNAEDPDFVEAVRIGEQNATLDPAARNAAANAFHNQRIADGAPVGSGTSRMPISTVAMAPEPASAPADEPEEVVAPTPRRGFQITSLLNEQPSRPDSRSSNTPFSFSSQTGREEHNDAPDVGPSSLRGPPTAGADDTDEETYISRAAPTHAVPAHTLHPPMGQEHAYYRQDGYGQYAARTSGMLATSPPYIAAPLSSRSTAPTYSYGYEAHEDRSDAAARESMPPPPISRRYDPRSPVMLSGHHHVNDGDRSEYARGSTPQGPTSPDLEHKQTLYNDHRAPQPWSAVAAGPPTSQSRSSSVRYAPIPVNRGYPIQPPSQSPPLRSIHSPSPVASLSTSAPSSHSMHPPSSRPSHFAYRSTSASVAPSYSSGAHAYQGETGDVSHSHGHPQSVARLMSRSPDHVAAPHRNSQGASYQHSHPQSHLSQHHAAPAPHQAAPSHSQAPPLPMPAYSSPSTSSYAPASVRSSAIPRGPATPISIQRSSTASSTSSGGHGPTSAPAYALSASRMAPTLPSIHTLGGPSRMLSSARPTSATSLDSPYGQISRSLPHPHSHQHHPLIHSALPQHSTSHAHSLSHPHPHSHAHASHSHSHSHAPTHPLAYSQLHSSHPSNSHMHPPPVHEMSRRSLSPGGMPPPASHTSNPYTSSHSLGGGYPTHSSGGGRSVSSGLHPPPLPHPHSLVHPHPHRGAPYGTSSSSSSSSSPRASPNLPHGYSSGGQPSGH
ncbi:hypothetical protein V8E36_001345 [Tilletia maclaganii]